MYCGLSRKKVEQIYKEVIRIRKETHNGQRTITQFINKRHKINFCENTIAGWIYRRIIPFANKKTQFKAKPLPPKNKIIKEYLTEKSLSELGVKFGVSGTTIKKWLKHYKVKIRNHKEAMNTKRLKELIGRQKVLMPKTGVGKMSSKKSYILGVLCGDGYIDNKMLKLEIRKDTEFIERFTNSINKVYTANYKYRYYPPRNSLIVDATRKAICKDLLSYGQFSTFKWQVPREITKMQNQNYIIHFLQGFFDSEGCVGKYLVSASSKNDKALSEIKKLLEKLEISSTIYGYVLVISKKANINKFRNTINFTIKRKTQKLENMYGGKWNDNKQNRKAILYCRDKHNSSSPSHKVVF